MNNKKIRDVLCIYPYRVELEKWNAFPPLGLEYVASIASEFAERIRIVDCRSGENPLEFVTPRTDLVLISWNWKLEMDFVSEVIRSIPDNITTVVGGRYASQFIDEVFSDFPNVDIIIRGEGEDAIREYLGNGKPKDIANLSYRKNGKVVHNPPVAIKHIADSAPDRSLRRMRYEIKLLDTKLGLEMDSIATSRGCPFNCAFCTFSVGPYGLKRPWAARSPESVVDELAEIRAPIVGIVDDNLTVKLDRVEEICDLILARGIRKHYVFNARIDIYKRPKLLRKMHRAGFLIACVGIESTSDELLKAVNKGFTVKKLRKAWAVLRKSGFIYHGYFMIGLLGETLEDKLRIAPLAHELGIDTLGIQILRLEQHSPLAKQVAETPGYRVNEEGYVVSDEFPFRYMRKLRRQISRRFYTPRQIFQIGSKLWRAGVLADVGLIARLTKFMAVGTCRHIYRNYLKWSHPSRAERKIAAQKAAAEKTAATS
jgi:radical SAM superfamily enzyme YgiQ (UPF0313 family)